MAFKSLNHVLGNLEDRYQRQEQRNFQALLTCWPDAVGDVVAAQTRPTSIQRGVLHVATSSSPWAQNLIFERQRILEKLNLLLSYSLVDIRFSTAQWHDQARLYAAGTEEQAQLWQNHPCRVSHSAALQKRGLQAELTSPASAFQAWAVLMRSRAQHLPLCPQCHAPTPIGELERWAICALCIAKQW